jgi:hypothetical protein
MACVDQLGIDAEVLGVHVEIRGGAELGAGRVWREEGNGTVITGTLPRDGALSSESAIRTFVCPSTL